MKKIVNEIFVGQYVRLRTANIHVNAYSMLCGILNVKS